MTPHMRSHPMVAALVVNSEVVEDMVDIWAPGISMKSVVPAVDPVHVAPDPELRAVPAAEIPNDLANFGEKQVLQ